IGDRAKTPGAGTDPPAGRQRARALPRAQVQARRAEDRRTCGALIPASKRIERGIYSDRISFFLIFIFHSGLPALEYARAPSGSARRGARFCKQSAQERWGNIDDDLSKTARRRQSQTAAFARGSARTRTGTRQI